MESVEYQLIETVVRRTLADIQDSPERTIRNLIDMALHFAEGRFERDFFSIAQRMLEDSRSAYYDLVKDAAMNVDTERILRFGMNLGYNGCALGAKNIRQLEAQHRFNIPWSLSLIIDTARISKLKDHYHDFIAQANALGIYTFLIRAKGRAQEILSLIEQHKNSAFILRCEAKEITSSFVSACEELHHMMLSVYLDNHADDACALLRKHKYLYSLEIPYDAGNVASIVSGSVFDISQTLHPAFTLLTPKRSCADSIRSAVYNAVRSAREEQQYRTIPLDTVCDFEVIDSIISSEACSACFDENGSLQFVSDQKNHGAGSIFERPLFDVLREAFPKT